MLKKETKGRKNVHIGAGAVIKIHGSADPKEIFLRNTADTTTVVFWIRIHIELAPWIRVRIEVECWIRIRNGTYATAR